MAYQGYLIRIHHSALSDYDVPLGIMANKSFHCIVHGQSLDPFTNTEGVTTLNSLVNKKPTCEFTTIGGLTQTQISAMLSQIQARYINELDKTVNASIFSWELNRYINQTWYIPDLDATIDEIDENEITYEPIKFEFISVGGPV